MADILYVYKKQVYVNLTNKCSGRCIFCVRNKQSGVGGNNLVLKKDPSLEELKKELVRPPYEHAYEGVIQFGVAAKSLGKEVAFSVLTILSEEEINQCRSLANKLEIPLEVRKYEE